jgi:probable HAF family extracellular repeat protein
MMRMHECLILGLLLGAAPHVKADILYRVTDLGTGVRGINDAGQVVGASLTYTASGSYFYRAFLYSNGQKMDLGTLPGYSNSYGFAINNAGQVTGSSYDPISGGHAFLYNHGQMTDLGTLPGYSSSVGSGINDAGQVVGSSTNPFPGTQHAFVYSNGQMMDLGTLGGSYSAASGISNAGQVTGAASTSAGAGHAFLYSNGQMQDLGTLGGSYSAAYGINDAGQVTGGATLVDSTSSTPSVSHAFLYRNGQMMDLGILPTNPGYLTSYSEGFAINDAGQVVGSSHFGLGHFQSSHAFLYSSGQMRDLNSLIDPTLGITLYEARAINNNGQIVADHYLLTPVPEPSTLALFGVALLGFGAYLRRQPSLFR